MQRVNREVSIGVCMCNDVASLQKELRLGDGDSIISVLVQQRGCGAQKAVDKAVEMIKRS